MAKVMRIDDPLIGAACIACASLLANVVGDPVHRGFSEKDEKSDWSDPTSLMKHFQYQCCGRYLCGICFENKPSLGKYCLFCLNPKLPPPTQTRKKCETELAVRGDDPPPPYSSLDPLPDANSNSGSTSSGFVVHYLQPDDTLPRLSLMYSTPIHILRSCNKLFSDHLLKAKSFITIPRAYYNGPSKSPDPVQTERESLLKRFQVRSKCVDYDIAKVYLEGNDWDLELAVQRWEEDDRWEKEFGKQKNKGKGSMWSRGIRR